MTFSPTPVISLEADPIDHTVCSVVPPRACPSVCSIQHDPRATIKELTSLVRIRIRSNFETIWVDFQDLEICSVTSSVPRPHRSAVIGVRHRIRVQLRRERAPVPNHITCETRVGTLRRDGREKRCWSGVDLCPGVEDEFVYRQVVLAVCKRLVVGWAVDHIVSIDLLGSPVL
jgi:hypothetical protein